VVLGANSLRTCTGKVPGERGQPSGVIGYVHGERTRKSRSWRLIPIFSAFVRNSPDKPVSNRHFFSAVSMKNESPASAQQS